MGATPDIDAASDRVEVRLLGPLRVRRADGSFVEPREWGTQQTADLLRILALHVNEPVPVDVLLDRLWPAVDEAKGRASLRNAASRLRKTLGGDVVERKLGGLVLSGAWVDASAFRMQAREVRRHMVTGAFAQAVTVTREAQALYLGDFRASNGSASWALTECDALAASYRRMVADAADAAVTLGWWHDALDLAEELLRIDPVSERAFRAIMRASHGVGEISRALQAYEQCRRRLAEEIGADPSAETKALHLELLDQQPAEQPAPPFRGRDHELEWLRRVARAVAEDGVPAVVGVLGDAGSGKTRLLHEAWREADVAYAYVPAAAAMELGESLEHALADTLGVARDTPSVVVLDDVHQLAPEAADRLASTLAGVRGPVTVVVAGRANLGTSSLHRITEALTAQHPGRGHVLRLQGLVPEDVGRLCSGLLCGDVSSQLVGAAVRDSAGLPGTVVRVVREWARSGRVAATTEGLVVLEGSSGPSTQTRRRLASAVDHLDSGELEVLQLVTVLGRPVAPCLLLDLLAERPPGRPDNEEWLRKVLDHLVDLKLLTTSDAGIGPRDPLQRDALVAWLRPSVLRRLHRRVAERAQISSQERVEHWARGGEPQLARAASLDAANEALAEGRHDDARAALQRLCQSAAAAGAAPADRVELFELLGDACVALGRFHEAATAYATAAGTARAGGNPGAAAAARLDHKRSTAEQRTAVPVTSPAPVAEAVRQDGTRHAVLATLHTAITVCVSRRDFWTARQRALEVLHTTTDPVVTARAHLVGWFPAAVLGDAREAEAALSTASDLLREDDDLRTEVAALRCLVAHDLGRPEFPALHAAAADAGAFDAGSDHEWVHVRIATERGDLASAQHADASWPVPASPVLRQLGDLASALLAIRLGRVEPARAHLQAVLDLADKTGTTLGVPEAALRMAILEAATDPRSARERFELFEWAVGGGWLPRENVLRLLARAAIRAADGRADDAVAAATVAADVAERSHLPFLAAEAHQVRALHLSAAGRPTEARLASATAARRLDGLSAAGGDVLQSRGGPDGRHEDLARALR